MVSHCRDSLLLNGINFKSKSHYSEQKFFNSLINSVVFSRNSGDIIEKNIEDFS